ncbi:Phytochrome-like protein cph2 [Pseudidiomarina piscicola]|uniref:diguanylate cyclase n=1 Tax=Pseudidiomarina piscicola TaxID=2614830 RepID=A0A6S6WNM4_9GAMM|nr:diguanylate cyclase [Pseudidiomarina piscicola]CAB0150772.1 Phytochrome-like protein cph2 [Pseudidiomarina piscicola]VZT40275.1 Phytochrome-like protein cph2 [Pseudomonas aeruginosa]
MTIRTKYPFWRHISLRAQLIAGFLVPLLVVAGLSWIVSVNMQDVQQLSAESDRVAREIAVRKALLKEVVDAETGERGFIITGEEEFLEPYQSAKTNFSQLANEWRELSGASSDPKLKEMEQLFQLWLAEIAEPAIKARAQYGPEAIGSPELEANPSTALVASGRGKQLVDTMRAVIAEAVAEKEQQRETIASRVDERMRFVATLAIVLPVVGVGIGLVLLLLMQMGVVSSIGNLSETASKIEAGDLSARVDETRSDEIGELAKDFNRMAAILELGQRESTILSSFQSMLVSSNDEEETYAAAARALSKLFPSMSGALYLVASSRDLVEMACSWGDHPQTEKWFPPEDCRALRLGRSYRVSDDSAELFCRHVKEDDNAIAFSLCIPLVTRDEVVGTLFLCEPTSGPSAVSAQEIAVAETVAERLALALNNLRLTERLRRESVRDPLTELFNRRYLEETLEREIRRVSRAKKPLSLVALDVDHFKHFNDTFGHEAGDRVLEALAKEMVKIARPEDVACRYGGEEFMLILPEVNLEMAAERAEELRLNIEKLQLSYGGTSLGKVTVSLGVATFPLHSKKKDELMRFADNALYEAKRQGRNKVVVYGAS